MLGIVSKGIIIGVLVSAPMGPIGMLCIQRTLNKGRWHGFVTGLGAALSDVIYAALTCLGMGVVVNFVEANQAPLQLIGSIVLGIFGYYIFQSNPTRNLKKLWWFGITYIIGKLRKWFNVRGIWLLNRIVGSVIIVLSIIGALSVLLTSYLQWPLLQIYS